MNSRFLLNDLFPFKSVSGPATHITKLFMVSPSCKVCLLVGHVSGIFPFSSFLWLKPISRHSFFLSSSRSTDPQFVPDLLHLGTNETKTQYKKWCLISLLSSHPRRTVKSQNSSRKNTTRSWQGFSIPIIYIYSKTEFIYWIHYCYLDSKSF